MDYAVPAAINPLPSGVEQECSGDDDYGRLGFVSGWGAAGTFGGTKVSRAVGFDWLGFADGNCDEKFDFAGGLRDYESPGKPMYEATLQEGWRGCGQF